MSLYLEGGAWFKKKNTLGTQKCFGDQKERIVTCQQASRPEEEVISLRPGFFVFFFFLFVHLREAPDSEKGRDSWPPRDSVFIPICHRRDRSKPHTKEIGSVSGKTDTRMSLLSCSPFLWPNPKGFSLFSSAHFPTTLCVSNLSISLSFDMYVSKDANAVPTFEFPASDGAGPRQEAACGGARAGGAAWVWGGRGNVCGVCIGST